MSGLSETQIGRPSSFAAFVPNFIMMEGPMHQQRSTFSPRSTTIFIASVTTPFMPSEPSSVVTMSSSEYFAHSSFMTTRLEVRPPRIVMTLLPCCLRALMIG